MIHSALFAVQLGNVGRPDVAGERMESKYAKLGWVTVVWAHLISESADLPVGSDRLLFIHLKIV